MVKGQPIDYFFEMLAALQTADDTTSFLHPGAHREPVALSLGVFPDRIRFRRGTERRPWPELLRRTGKIELPRGE